MFQKKRSNRARGEVAVPHPPQIRTEIIHRRRLRFVMPAVGVNITFQNICDTINVATAATTAYQLFDFVRVIRVEIWCEGAIGTNATVTLNFSGQTAGITGDQDQWTDTQMGIQPAHVVARPSRRCTASMWQPGSSANNAFGVTATVAGIIDVELEFKISEAYIPQTVQNAPSGLSAGNIYYRSLNGVANGAFIPQGVVNVD